MKKIVKKNYKLIVGIIVGLMISSIGVYAVNTLAGNEVSYNNETSGLTSNTVQGAIDELYNKADAQKKKMPKPGNTNIVSVYYYNQEKGSDDFCVTGDEDTCKVNTCYLNKAKDSCEPGTIIEYNVKDGEKVRFHVVHDDGETMTLQSQKNTIFQTAWYTSNDTTKGPENILSKIETETESWVNVKQLAYSIGDDSTTLEYSGCANANLDCNSRIYELIKNDVRVRMITIQELVKLGCTEKGATCPIWVYNYLSSSQSSGGTVNDQHGYGYWTMSGYNNYRAWYMSASNIIYHSDPADSSQGARAVVEINK